MDLCERCPTSLGTLPSYKSPLGDTPMEILVTVLLNSPPPPRPRFPRGSSSQCLRELTSPKSCLQAPKFPSFSMPQWLHTLGTLCQVELLLVPPGLSGRSSLSFFSPWTQFLSQTQQTFLKPVLVRMGGLSTARRPATPGQKRQN